MRADDVIRLVTEHLQNGGDAELSINREGRRFVKLVKWGFLGDKYEISGATEATLQRLLARDKATTPSAA